MAKHDAQARAKRIRNDAYARMYPRRSPVARREARANRTAAREAAWLLAMGITPEPVKPFVPRRRRRRR